MYVLGIDGGGTKTTGVISDVFGNVFASETVGATNQNGVAIEVVERELSTLFSSLKSQNGKVFSMLTAVFAGMSGVDRPQAKQVIKGILEKFAPPQVQIFIDNDAVNALYSGTLGAPGIVQIAGTGSIAYGMNDKGERQRVGGWGYLIDDEGSGYDIGRAALHAVFRAYDGRGPKTILTHLILKHFGIQDPSDLITYIYEPGKSRMAIAPLSRYVSEAVDKGDEVAQQIIQQAGAKLADSIGSLSKSLFQHHSEAIPVVVVGGMFNRSDLLLPIIQAELQQRNIPVQLIKPELAPVCGAVVAGFASIEQTVEASFVENMKRI